MAKIFLYDEFTPEDNAMLQALYSRSPRSVAEHVEKVKKAGSGKFMEKFYVNYGHKSIADCGSTTIFIEKISILADKAIQDWPLYSGQETSTRYVDMAQQPIIDPLGTEQTKEIINAWMDFYKKSQPKLLAYLREKYPFDQSETEAVYEKALAARCFDILRAFLPAGITTQLSWHTNLRQAWDKISLLRHHPLAEVKDIAAEMLRRLKEKYPHSFSHKFYPEQEEYEEQVMKKYNYYQGDLEGDFQADFNLKLAELEKYKDILTSRPLKTNLPHFLTEAGNIIFDFKLDYGSFRDIQRHRNGVCRMPLLTNKHGFQKWYLEQLPADLRQEAEGLIKKQNERLAALATTPEVKQYYLALGYNVIGRVSYALPATVYVIELRSTRFVHPTLRALAHKMHYAVKEKIPYLTLHTDLSPSRWDIGRGKQDIIKKE